MKWYHYALILVILEVIWGGYVFMYSKQTYQIDSNNQRFSYEAQNVIQQTSSTSQIGAETFSVTVSNGNLNIDYQNYGLSLSPVFVMQNGNRYTWGNIPATIEKDLWKQKISETEYKYGVTFSNVSTTVKNNLQFLVLHREEVRNLTLQDIDIKENTIFIKDKIRLSHDDLLQTYTIPVINRTDIVIGNITSNFVSNGDGTWNITFDPTISLLTSLSSRDLLVNITSETNNFTHLNISTTAPYNSLIAYYPLDNDIILNGYHVNGKIGGAQYFDSVDDFVYVPTSTNLTGKNITITGWINLTTIDTKGIILKGWNAVGGYGLRLGSTGQVVASLSNMTAYREYVSPNAVTANEWSMITMTYDVDNNNLTIYENATPIYSINPVGETKADSTAGWYLGRRGDSAWYLKGTMDEFKAYSRLLNSTELTTIYNEESSGNPTTVDDTGLILYLPLNDSNGTIAKDYANNLNGYSMGYAKAVDYVKDADGTYNVASWNIENGIYGSGANFDKSSGGINMGIQSQFSNLCNSTSGLTITAWIKPLDAGENSEGGIMGKAGEPSTSNGRWMFRLASNRLSFAKGYSGAVLAKTTATATPITFGTWQHVAMTWNCSTNMYDDNVLKFYINASETQYLTRINGSGAYNDDSSLAFGIVPDSNRVFNGTIDEVMIFNVSLNSTQINDIFLNQSARFFPQGTQDSLFFNITKGDNRVNVSIDNMQTYLNSSIQLKLGEWDIQKEYNVTDSNLVVYYNFDNRSSLGDNATLVRDRMNNINGTLNTDMFVNGSGAFEGGINFDGTNDYVNIPNNAKIQATSFTVNIWVKPSALMNSSIRKTIPIVTKWYSTANTGFNLMYLNSTNEDGLPAGLTMGFFNGDWYSANTKQNLSADEWHMITGAYSSTTETAYIYIDGNYVADSSSGGTFTFAPNTDLDMQIGRDTERDYVFSSGKMDEFTYFNTSLSPERIKELYVKGRANWVYGDYQTINTTNNYTFTINTSTTHIQPSFKQTAGTNNFYSPALGGTSTYDTYTVSESPPVTDYEYPIFSDYYDNNGTLIDSGIGLFNVTIINTNGTVFLEINGANHSATNLTATMYNISTTLTAGTYSYYWGAWGNGSNNNYNISVIRSYTVNSSPAGDTTPPYFTAIPSDANLQYGQSLSIDFNATDETGLDGYFINWTTHFTIDRSTGTITNISGLRAGTYLINISINDTSNNKNSTIYTLTVNQNSTYNISISATSPITYGDTTDFTGAGCPSQLSCSLNISNAIYGAGTIWANYSTSGNQNYTANSGVKSIVINKNGTYTLTLTATSPITYGTATDFSGSGCPSQLTCSLNITNQVYGVGTIWANYSTSGNNNYSANSAVNSVVINQATGSISLTLNGTAGDISPRYPSQINASARTTTGQVITLLRNGADVTSLNHAFENIAAGYYNFTANAANNQNYTAATITYFANLTNGTSTTYTYINHTRSNKNYVNGTVVWLNGTLVTGQFGNLNLTINGTQLNYSSSNIAHWYQFNYSGSFIIKTNFPGSQNYSPSSEQYTVTITIPTSGGTSNATVVSARYCRYKKLGYYNTRLPWAREVNCI